MSLAGPMSQPNSTRNAPLTKGHVWRQHCNSTVNAVFSANPYPSTVLSAISPASETSI
jgi:hypothetical protein